MDIIMALGTMIIAFFSIGTYYLQRKHNRKSLTPVADFAIKDYENLLEVNLVNRGVGPLIIKEFKVFKDKEFKLDLISWMPNKINWDNFYKNFQDVCISPNQTIVILKLSGNVLNDEFKKCRDEIRKILSNLRMELRYKDIYDNEMPLKEKKLSWYGRHTKK